MISSKELQNEYVKMYEKIREYIWPFETVKRLAALEVSVYTTFPSPEQIKKDFNTLYLDIRDMFDDDDELKEAVEDFKKTIETLESETFYSKLNQVQEAV